MTEQEKLEWKDKALPIVVEHLQKTINYPNCGGDQIMNQVAPMWELLVKSNLIPEGMTFQMFVNSAHKKYMEREMWRIIGL